MGGHGVLLVRERFPGAGVPDPQAERTQDLNLVERRANRLSCRAPLLSESGLIQLIGISLVPIFGNGALFCLSPCAARSNCQGVPAQGAPGIGAGREDLNLWPWAVRRTRGPAEGSICHAYLCVPPSEIWSPSYNTPCGPPRSGQRRCSFVAESCWNSAMAHLGLFLKTRCSSVFRPSASDSVNVAGDRTPLF